ncbi:hypothetical protein MTR67_031117, partial [Solanum verrucosum]
FRTNLKLVEAGKKVCCKLLQLAQHKGSLEHGRLDYTRNTYSITLMRKDCPIVQKVFHPWIGNIWFHILEVQNLR